MEKLDLHKISHAQALVLVENFISKGDTCKKVRFNQPLRLSNIDEVTDVSLDLCKINEKYEISSINISK